MQNKDARAPWFVPRGRCALRGSLFARSVFLPLSILALAALSPAGEASGVKNATRAAEKSTAELAVYALSRGKGVPEATRAALGKARKLEMALLNQ